MYNLAQVDGRGEGTYKCGLDKEDEEKAIRELNENPLERANQIDQLRTWVKEQNHFVTRTDDHFLLRFLRRAKFSQLVARELVSNFTVTHSPNGGMPWFKGDLSLGNSKIVKMLKTGTCLPLPGRDDEGRTVTIIRTGCYAPEDFMDHVKTALLCLDVGLRDEASQVHGYVTVLDFSEFTSSHVGCMGMDTVKKMMKTWQDSYPIRIKGIHYYKAPAIFEVVLKLFRLFMKEKTKNRLHFHGSSLESLHKQVPKRMLPSEYGGDLGPRQEMLDEWIKVLDAHKEEFELNKVFWADETLAPQEKSTSDDGWGMTGTYRKLNVD